MPVFIVTFLAAIVTIGAIMGISGGAAVTPVTTGILATGTILYTLLAIAIIVAIIVICFLVVKRERQGKQAAHEETGDGSMKP
tara:strand:+ start:320 stop:568 length:249 start_codon:yes stop_codon:yes gene_type:complete